MAPIVLYNHYGAGDIFESREFAKEYMLDYPNAIFYYAHGKHPRILKDLPEFTYTPVIPELMPTHRPYNIVGDTIYINTWIGQDSKYVLPGIGCVVEKHYELHNDIRRLLHLTKLRKPVLDYIPDINYSFYTIDNIDKFVSNKKDRVLICNGNAQSMQAVNFDLDTTTQLLAHKFRDIDFICTQKFITALPNIYFTEDIIQADGCDLNEISYLSTFCRIIVGRNSGPHVFSQVKRNWLDINKTLVSFTIKEIASTFVLAKLGMKKVWSPTTNTTEAFTLIGSLC